MKGRYAALIAVMLIAGAALASCLAAGSDAGFDNPAMPDQDTTANPATADGQLMRVSRDSVSPADSLTRYTSLTDDDFRRVANELQVEVAAIKAVVVIEAGGAMEGFWGPGLPVVNCDRSLWGKMRGKVKSNAKLPAGAKVPSGLKHSFARRAWQKLINARKICIEQADLCTFWGMFQIGGFNYKLCGCSSITEFVQLMCYSELEQLELFAAMITNTGQVKYIRAKDWAGFSRSYNGPGYARRGYHTRMAAAYKRFSTK